MARLGGLLVMAAVAACSSSGGDAAITNKVRTVLQADRLVDASQIQVTTQRGVVTLDGSVAGDDAHRKAIDLVQSVEGVREVRDRLTVTPPPPAPADAAPPAAPAGGGGSPALGGVLVEERTRGRRPSSQPGGGYGLMGAVVGPQDDVTLETVAEPAVESSHREGGAAAEAIAHAAPPPAPPAHGDEAIGLSGLASPVPLGPPDEEDAAITARVRAALSAFGWRVQVLTRAGVVILSGAVDTELEKSQALRIARGTKGVSRVEDRLIVLVS